MACSCNETKLMVKKIKIFLLNIDQPHASTETKKKMNMPTNIYLIFLVVTSLFYLPSKCMDACQVQAETLIIDLENHTKVISFLHSLISGNLLFREDTIIEFRDYRDHQLVYLTNFEHIIEIVRRCQTFKNFSTSKFNTFAETDKKRKIIEYLKNPSLEEQKIEQIHAFKSFLVYKDLPDHLPQTALEQMKSIRTAIKQSLNLGMQSSFKKDTEQLNGAFSTMLGMPVHLQLKRVAELLEKDKISLNDIL